jgi:hypothetical protein
VSVYRWTEFLRPGGSTWTSSHREPYARIQRDKVEPSSIWPARPRLMWLPFSPGPKGLTSQERIGVLAAVAPKAQLLQKCHRFAHERGQVLQLAIAGIGIVEEFIVPQCQRAPQMQHTAHFAESRFKGGSANVNAVTS